MNRAALGGFAVDLGGTKTAAARIENGQIAARRQAATDGAAGLDAMLDHVADLLAGLGYSPGAPLGVAVTGRIGSDGRWQAVNQGTLSAIDGVPLKVALDTRFGNAAVGNDAALAAVAEAHFGAGRASRCFAYLTVSTGVGGGLVLDGRPVLSPNGLAGHVGFVTSPLGSARCGSGRLGTVESVAGGRAIAKAAADAGHPDTDARTVFSEALAGAEWAERIVDRSAAAIATLCADLTAILGLDRVALGGSIGLAPGYLDRVERHLAQEPALFRVPLGPAELGQDSALLGALALHHMKGTT
ncbi:ROK family protein [Maliponia aquimaris]|uniref:N-acetylmannosamine kinase n=1 Tax=Maliponia aquimaris TaxID=1673631 RepID=A0A238L1D0_9RHOB|nr:ROK family protein [Maliponia aquimaris]SMX48895.1 N-acetylmannosamine kinase [Maliponia aquimaris]